MATAPATIGARYAHKRARSVSSAHRAGRVNNSLRRRLENALGQLDELKRALAASQEQVELLTNAIGSLDCGAPQREVGRNPERVAAWAWTNLLLTKGLDPDESALAERLLTTRIHHRRGDALYQCGDAFDALYAIRVGSCKSVLLGADGQEQVNGYHMCGEIVGMDGIGSNVHESKAIALEDTDVCRLPFNWIDRLARLSDQFRRNLQQLLSQECARVQSRTLILGTMRSEQRLAVLLLDLSNRYKTRGYSSCEFQLRLTRAEIGSFLGLKLETVSRVFSRFQREGLLHVEGRLVKLLDKVALRQIADCNVQAPLN